MTTKSEPISLLFSFCKLQNFNDTKYYLFNMHFFHLHPVPSWVKPSINDNLVKFAFKENTIISPN